MTDILPPAGWPNVRQLETNEFATGGANGNMNEQAKSLAARSELLKKYAALPYESKTGGYALNERVQLATGDIVRSTIASNVNNPNENMTGWVKANDASQIFNESGKTQQEVNDLQSAKNLETISTADYGSAGKAQNIPVSDWYTIGSAYYRGYANLAAVQADYPHVTSASNTVDWAATQKACNEQKKHGSVKIVGCLFFAEGETLQMKEGQRLYGLNSGWFINTNNGTAFTGALTGDIPEYGIYSDRTSGSVIKAPVACKFEGFTLFGKGYTLADGSIDILKPADAALYPVVGIEAEKFILTSNFSSFYFGTAFKFTGGNYYSRFEKTEVTRCGIGFDYNIATYAQSFTNCAIRQVPTPFKFGGYARSFNYYGGSIEGFFSRTTYCVGVQPYSEINFWGTYFETFNTVPTVEVFRFLGGQSCLNFNGCTVYLHHVLKWVEAASVIRGKISSSNNEFLVANESTVPSPIVYNIPTNELNSAHELGLDFIRFDAAYPNKTGATGSITTGQKTLTVSDTTGFEPGVRVHITGAGLGGAELQTVVISRSASVVTLRDAAATTVSDAAIKQYWIPQYHQYGIGTGLSHVKIQYPRDYIPLFDKVEFKRNCGVFQALTSPPSNPFNAGAVGSVQLVADGTTWNPANKTDGRGAYPVALRSGKYIPMLGGFAGTFTLTAGTSTLVLNDAVSSGSKILLSPTNAAAAALNVYVSNKENGFRFTVTSTTAAAGTETFDYFIYD